MSDLLNALQFPVQIEIVKCAAHKSGCDFVIAVNRFADNMAKYYALESCTFNKEFPEESGNNVVTTLLLTAADTWEEVKDFQEEAPKSKQEKWVRAGCTKNQADVWVSADGSPVLPDSMLSPISRHFNGPAHKGRDAMV